MSSYPDPESTNLSTCLYTRPPPENLQPPIIGGRLVVRCDGCTKRRSDMFLPCDISSHKGCSTCVKSGIICIANQWAFPPHDIRTTWVRPRTSRDSDWTKCDHCRSIANCDRNHPCLVCHSRGRECSRIGGQKSGLIIRSRSEPLPGEKMRLYWIFHGPKHKDVPWPRPGPPARHFSRVNMPENYHIEYAYQHYLEQGWVPSDWFGPDHITDGAPEVPTQQGPIYVGAPSGKTVSVAISVLPMLDLTNISTDLFIIPVGELELTPAVGAVEPGNKVTPTNAPVKRRGRPRKHDREPLRIDPLTVTPVPLPSIPQISSQPTSFGPQRTPKTDKRTEPYFSRSGPLSSGLLNDSTLVSSNLSLGRQWEQVSGSTEPDAALTTQQSGDLVDIDMIDPALWKERNRQQQQVLPIRLLPEQQHWSNLSHIMVTVPNKWPVVDGIPHDHLVASDFNQISSSDHAHVNFFLDALLLRKEPGPYLPGDIAGQIELLDKHYQLRSDTDTNDIRCPKISCQISNRLLPHRPIPFPQPLGPEPGLYLGEDSLSSCIGRTPFETDQNIANLRGPEELVRQNEALFSQGGNERRLRWRWVNPIYYYGPNNNYANFTKYSFPWLSLIRESIMPKPIAVNVSSEAFERPASPGPLPPLFMDELSNGQIITNQNRGEQNHMWSDHPAWEFDLASPLLNIPKIRAWTKDAVGTVQKSCSSCGKSTRGICEAIDHHHLHRQYVCSVCDGQTRRKTWNVLLEHNVFMKLKRHACKECTSRILSNPEIFLKNCGRDVYDPNGLDANEYPVYDPRTKSSWITRSSEGDWTYHGSIQRPLPQSGCSCADKLLDRRLCNAHRAHGVHYLFDRMYKMAIYILKLYGTLEVCWACRQKPPQYPTGATDAYEVGRLWSCLCCSGLTLNVHPNELLKPLDEYHIYGD